MQSLNLPGSTPSITEQIARKSTTHRVEHPADHNGTPTEATQPPSEPNTLTQRAMEEAQARGEWALALTLKSRLESKTT